IRLLARTRLVPAIAALLLGFGLSPAFAASDDGAFSVRGIGAKRCAEMLPAAAGPNGAATKEILGSWVAGYLTHANRQTSGVFEAMSIGDTLIVAQMVVNLCRANPDRMVEAAVAS